MPNNRLQDRKDPNRGQVRVVFRPPPDFEPLTSVWCLLNGDTLRLVYDYPPEEFAPAPGWKVDVPSSEKYIVAINGELMKLGDSPTPLQEVSSADTTVVAGVTSDKSETIGRKIHRRRGGE